MHILCVDDDRGTLALVSRSLERACPEDEILTASSGEEAVVIIESQPVDLLVTDIVLPGISGIEVLDRAKRERPAVEAIMITGHTTPEAAVEAMQKGARDVLSKPLSIRLLVEKLEKLKEFILSRRELDDYRYLMSAIEEDVSRTALAASARLAELERRQVSIAAVLADRGGDREKLDRIAAILDGATEPANA